MCYKLRAQLEVNSLSTACYISSCFFRVGADQLHGVLFILTKITLLPVVDDERFVL